MLYYTILNNDSSPRQAYMIPAKMDIGTRTIVELDEFPRSILNNPFFRFGDKDVVENIAIMDYSQDR